MRVRGAVRGGWVGVVVGIMVRGEGENRGR